MLSWHYKETGHLIANDSELKILFNKIMLFSSLTPTFSCRSERRKAWTREVLKSISKLKSISANFNWPCEEHG